MMSFAQWGNALYSGKKSYKIIKHRNIFAVIGAALIIISVALIGLRGFNLSIDFTGGSQFTIKGVTSTGQQAAYEAVKSVGVGEGEARVSNLGSDSIRVQTPALDSEKMHEATVALAKAYKVDEQTVNANAIGPTWGKVVTDKALKSLVIFIIIVTVLMAAYFRSWTMSAAAIVALVHDVALTAGFFALVHVEVSPATMIGFLTILGYSLYDTVVVFDKIREKTVHVWDQRRFTYGELVNLAVNQTLVRSINTSIVALLPVGAILVIGSWLLGAGTLTDISLALFVGMLAGAYSSIFIASPYLVLFVGITKKHKDHDAQVLASRRKKSTVSADSEDGHEEEFAVGTKVIPGHSLPNSAQTGGKLKKRKK